MVGEYNCCLAIVRRVVICEICTETDMVETSRTLMCASCVMDEIEPFS